MANRVTIRIAGQTYTMLAEESKEYMHEVAALAQKVIASCGGSEDLATTRSLALATVNLADSYIKAQRAAEAAEARCLELETENEALRNQAQQSSQSPTDKPAESTNT